MAIPLQAIAQFFKITPQEILSSLDDFSLPLGRLEFDRAGDRAAITGLESVIVQFGTEEIPRLRVGIGPAPSEGIERLCAQQFFRGGKSARQIDNRASGGSGEMRD